MNITIHLEESGRSEGFRISPSTTCQDVLNAFQFPDNSQYELTEYWRDCGPLSFACERSIKENERLCDILRQWGPAAAEVRFFLKQVSNDGEENAAGRPKTVHSSQVYSKTPDISNADIPKVLASATATLEELKGIQAWQAEQIHLQQSVLRDKQQMLSSLAANSRTNSLNYTEENRVVNSNSTGPQRRRSLENGGQQQLGFPARNVYSRDLQQNAVPESPTGGQDNQKLTQLQRLKQEFERSRSNSASEGSSKPFPNSQIQNTANFRLPNNESANISSSSSSNENRFAASLAPTNQHLMNELDSVRAMFSDKEKELSVAVAKVEELTSQLEVLRASTQVLPWPNASSSAAVDSSTLYLQNKIGAESGNNLVFDRMNSQLLMRNMMNKEQSMKLEARKSYLTERVTELDNLHAKMKALNDRINQIKDQQQAPPQLHAVANIAPESNDSFNTSRVSESNTSTIRNQFAPVRRFDTRQDPPPVAQVSPMRLTPNTPSPTINTPDKNQGDIKFANAFIDINLSNSKVPPSPVPSLKMSSNGSRGGSTGSPSASPFSNSPAHSPNTYSSKQKYHEEYGARSEFKPEENNQKMATVRPMQLRNDSSAERRSSNYSPVQKNLIVPRDNHYSVAVEQKTPHSSEKMKNINLSNNVGNSKQQSPPVSKNYGDAASVYGVSQVKRELKFPTTDHAFDYGNTSNEFEPGIANKMAFSMEKGANSVIKSNDSKSSGVYTAEDRLSDETSKIDLDLEDSAKNPVIHQYPILQQFVANQSNESSPMNESAATNGSKTVTHTPVTVNYPRPSAYERLFPAPQKLKAATEVDQGGVPESNAQQVNVANEENMLDGSKSSIHIDKTTGAKQIRRRSSLMNMEHKDLVILQNRHPQYMEGENQFSSFKPSSFPSKKPVVGILRKSRPTNALPGDRQKKRRVTFDKLALFLDAALDGDLSLVENLFNQLDNPSEGNDEGITALHNAICAGHAAVVDFLVQHGCDVNAADSDGWTPLHCAASCNNVMMVKYLVEHGACIFARTFSDGETPADKCEEQEPNYASCSQYLYGVQEKLGIMNRGVVYALYHFDANNDDELSVIEGDAVMVLRRGDEDEGPEWWFALLGGSNQSEKGYIPRNILGLFPRVTSRQDSPQ